ncbi:hypothetical protein D3C87_2152740 [compost metagenome]
MRGWAFLRYFYYALRQLLMKVLRASPASFLVAASALHFFMRSCGVVGAAGAAACELRHVLCADL